jgi:hypothetical protein
LKGLVELGNKIGLALNAIQMAEKRNLSSPERAPLKSAHV